MMTYRLIILLLALQTSLSHASNIKVGIIEYPPYVNFHNDIKNEKAFIYLNRILKQKFAIVEFIKYPNKRALTELKKGNIDLLYPIDDPNNQFTHLTKPLFYTTPGLCFNKQNFIPILSATHKFNNLTIGIPANSDIVPTLANSKAKFFNIAGEDSLNRGIELLQKQRIDALFHPSPIKVYHHTNPLSKTLACSYFHGYSNGAYIATSPSMSSQVFKLIDNAFSTAMKQESYEYYFAK